MLQHALLISNDHVRSIQIEELFQPVITIDQTAIEIVEVRRCEIAAFEQDQRTQVGWNYRNDVHDHPVCLVAGIEDGLDDLQTLDDVFCFLL